MLGHDAPKQSSWEGGRRKPGLRDASIYVRYASNTDRIDASQQNVARCHKRL
jgi:hypothetical protein